MNTNRLIAGTLAGGIVLHAVGYLFWGVLFSDFFAANRGSATGVAREAQLFWAVAVGNLALAALLTLAIGTRRTAATLMDGARIGAIVQFLVWLGVDFILYGATNSNNLAGTLLDPVLEFVHGGAAGLVIAAVISRIGAPAAREMQHA